MAVTARVGAGVVERQAGGSPALRVLVSPEFLTPFRRRIVRDLGTEYELGELTWGWRPRYTRLTRESAGRDDPASLAASQTQEGAAFLRWARFPRFAVQRQGDSVRVTISDLRYDDGRGGSWASVRIILPGYSLTAFLSVDSRQLLRTDPAMIGPRRGLVVVVFALGTVACREAPKPAPPDAAVTSSLYDLNLPARWAGAYRTDSLSTAELGTADHGALNIKYLPADTTIVPQTLVVIATYDSAAWSAVRAEGGPRPGDSVAARNGKVFVVALPQSNPFAPGSVDAVRFDALQLKPEEVPGVIRPR
jgi:hypothetical protein